MSLRKLVMLQLLELREKVRKPGPLLEQIGKIVTRTCRMSFKLQRLGDREWPPRYPRQRGPKLNIAGALQDFIDGADAPKSNRFEDTPANVDTGELSKSIRYTVSGGSTVKIRSDSDHALAAQEGGESEQTYGEDTQTRIKNWLFEDRQGRNQRGQFTPKRQTVREGREGYVQHLNQFLHKTTHRQQIISRPFIGVTDEDETKIARAIRRHLSLRRRA